MREPALEQKLNENGILATFKEANAFYQKWHNTFSKIKTYHKQIKESFQQENRGDVFQTYKPEFQLKNYITSLGGFKNIHQKPEEATKSLLSNFPIQAACAEI